MSRSRFLASPIFVLVTLVTGAVHSQSDDYVFSLTSFELHALTPGALPVVLDNATGGAVEGFSLAVRHDDQVIGLLAVEPGAAIADFNGGAGPDFFSPTLDPFNGPGFTVGVVFNFLGLHVLPPDSDHHVLNVTYDADLPQVGAVTNVEFATDLGEPVTQNVAVSSGISYDPTLNDGTVTVREPLGFVRGDFDGDQVLTPFDVDSILEYTFPNCATACTPLTSGLVPPENCQGEVAFDVLDLNDDEQLTIGDYLLARAAVAGLPVDVPFPLEYCSPDPDDSTANFGVGPGYVIKAKSVCVGDVFAGCPADDPASEQDVRIWMSLDTQSVGAAPARGFTAIIRLPAGLSDPDGPFNVPMFEDRFSEPIAGIETRVVVFASPDTGDRDLLLVSVYPSDPDGFLPNHPLQTIGALRLKLKPFHVFGPLELVSEIDYGGLTYRSAVVGEDFRDHAATFEVGETAFVRGNSNDDDMVNIADAVDILEFLFLSDTAPVCFHAANANNQGGIDIADAITVLQFLFVQGSPPIPAPYPACGLDDGPIEPELSAYDPSQPDVQWCGESALCPPTP